MTLREVLQITSIFRLLNPEDPPVYEVALSRLPILGVYRQDLRKPQYRICPLSTVCIAYRQHMIKVGKH